MEPAMRKPDSGLVWAILTTVLCCMPFGIVAIVKAAQVDTFWAAGNDEEAARAAASSRTWSWISAGIAIAVWVIYLLVIIGTIGLAAMFTPD